MIFHGGGEFTETTTADPLAEASGSFSTMPSFSLVLSGPIVSLFKA